MLEFWESAIDLLSSLTVVYTFVATSVFIAIFAREPWRKTWFGQSIMILAVALWIFSVMGVLATWWPDYPLREEVRLIGRLMVATAMTQRLVVLIHLRRRHPKP